MNIAFPHDELMPIACAPRIRGVTPSRGDVDDALGKSVTSDLFLYKFCFLVSLSR